jgi:hypothetical protein
VSCGRGALDAVGPGLPAARLQHRSAPDARPGRARPRRARPPDTRPKMCPAAGHPQAVPCRRTPAPGRAPPPVAPPQGRPADHRQPAASALAAAAMKKTISTQEVRLCETAAFAREPSSRHLSAIQKTISERLGRSSQLFPTATAAVALPVPPAKSGRPRDRRKFVTVHSDRGHTVRSVNPLEWRAE